MATTAKRTDPALWDRIKAQVTEGEKGGHAGQWSARKAQLAVHEYKAAGGTYSGKKDPHNHLAEWTQEDWGTKSGHDSAETGERYLPREARDTLTPEEYKRTTDKKRADTAKGKQFSAQPKDVAEKTAPARHHPGPDTTVAELRTMATERNIPGRSRMTKAQLLKALA